MTDIVIQTKKNGIAVNGLTDDPEVTIIRLDTDAVVVNGDAMSDTGTGGLYKYDFAPVAGLAYGFSVDADPNNTDQTDDLFYAGGFDFTVVSQAYTDGAVWLDTLSGGSAGTELGVNGIPTNPSDNIVDAIAIATALNIKYLKVRGVVTLTSAIPGFRIEGIAGVGAFDPDGFDVGNCYFDRINLIGDIDTTSGSIYANESSLVGTTGFMGILARSIIGGTNVLGAGASVFADCVSGVPGIGTPVIDLDGVASFSLRDYSGGMELRGSSNAAQNTSLEIAQGQCILAADNTAGTIKLAGVMSPITDNSAGATVVRVAALEPIRVDNIWQERGLDPDNPTTYRPDKVFAGAEGSPELEIAVTGDCETETVYTRQP